MTSQDSYDNYRKVLGEIVRHKQTLKNVLKSTFHDATVKPPAETPYAFVSSRVSCDPKANSGMDMLDVCLEKTTRGIHRIVLDILSGKPSPSITYECWERQPPRHKKGNGDELYRHCHTLSCYKRV